jgi:predicted Fe-S protein YdhL (DUF1289 family)
MMKNLNPQTYAGNVPTPCISVCIMNPQTGLCDGCLRTIDEIAQWGSATEEAKRKVWIEIKRRQHEYRIL